MGIVFGLNHIRLLLLVVTLVQTTGCTFTLRSVLLESTTVTAAKHYTVLTSKDDGCTNNTFRKDSWTSGLELLCQTSQAVGIKSVVAPSTLLVTNEAGKKQPCWIALSDVANEGRKVFCVYDGNVIKLSTGALDIPEQVMKSTGNSLFFFGRKLNSKFVLYRWDWKTVTELSGNYSGAGSW
jgi:hypothetical protein